MIALPDAGEGLPPPPHPPVCPPLNTSLEESGDGGRNLSTGTSEPFRFLAPARSASRVAPTDRVRLAVTIFNSMIQYVVWCDTALRELAYSHLILCLTYNAMFN